MLWAAHLQVHILTQRHFLRVDVEYPALGLHVRQREIDLPVNPAGQRRTWLETVSKLDCQRRALLNTARPTQIQSDGSPSPPLPLCLSASPASPCLLLSFAPAGAKQGWVQRLDLVRGQDDLDVCSHPPLSVGPETSSGLI